MRKAAVAVVTPACTGCGACLAPCEPRAVLLASERPGGFGAKRAVVLLSRCTGCGACVPACPHGAISLRRGPRHFPSTPSSTTPGPRAR